MNLLAVVRLYAGRSDAGAERMLHAILRDMIQRGHTATVLSPQVHDYTDAYQIDGVDVGPLDERIIESGGWHRPSLVLTQIDGYQHARSWSERLGVPLVHFAHSENQVWPASLVVVNSEWLAAACFSVLPAGRWVVCRPPVDPAEYQVTRHGDAVTLINRSALKGAPLVYDLARRLPDRRFLAVTGGWDTQLDPPQGLDNVTVVDNTPRVQRVYEQTRVLLMPSAYESWGRCAVEAAASGIPTVAHPTRGLCEALGQAGIYRDRGDINGWVDALRCLDEPAAYECHSRLAQRRAHELADASHGDLDRLERYLLATAAG